jgi:hypothetical protein
LTGSKMMRQIVVAGSAALGLLSAAPPALAHHSFASYAVKGQIKLSGTVTRFEWANPHVYIHLDATGRYGGVKHWLIECANPGTLNRIGWKRNMIHQGDKIEVIVAPLRSGRPGALLKAIRLADGRTFSNGGPAGRATISFDD